MTRATTGADSVARLPITPKPEAPNGRQATRSESGLVSVAFDLAGLANRIYGAPIGSWDTAQSPAIAAATSVAMEWHVGGADGVARATTDTLDFTISNAYDVGSKVGAFALTRQGLDSARGTLTLQDDAVYRGTASLAVLSRVSVPGQTCALYGFAWQYADVVAVPIARSQSPGQQTGAFYTDVHQPADYTWLRGRESA